jgi:stage II sporulation protein P
MKVKISTKDVLILVLSLILVLAIVWCGIAAVTGRFRANNARIVDATATPYQTLEPTETPLQASAPTETPPQASAPTETPPQTIAPISMPHVFEQEDGEPDEGDSEPEPTATAQAEGQQTEARFTNELIMGESILTAKELAAYALSRNANPKLNCAIEELARLFIDEGKAEGVRGDLAFCQSLLETGCFAYGNLVLPEQNNYAGLGAINGSDVGEGAWFETPQEGVRAQIQHLKGYATTEPLNQERVDPRYDKLDAAGFMGSAKTITQLNGKWATPGDTYGEEILSLYWKACKLAGYSVPSEYPTPSVSPSPSVLPTRLEIAFLTSYPEQIASYNTGIQIVRHLPTVTANGKRILLYHSHSEEGYDDGGKNTYTRVISNSVIGAGRALATEMAGKGYEVWHVISNFTYATSARKWDGTSQQYVRSYAAVEAVKKAHGTFDLFIDFHRDSRGEDEAAGSKAAAPVSGMATFSFCACEGRNLKANSARRNLMNYSRTLSDAEAIQNFLNAQCEGLSPRIFKKPNSSYNQDVGRHVFVEAGFDRNTYAQVLKGVPILAKGIDAILK